MQNMHEWDVYCIVRSEELGVRSDGRGAQLIKHPNTHFIKVIVLLFLVANIAI